MSTKALIIVLVAAAVLVGGAFLMHEHGHQLLAKWMPALHGR